MALPFKREYLIAFDWVLIAFRLSSVYGILYICSKTNVNKILLKYSQLVALWSSQLMALETGSLFGYVITRELRGDPSGL